jgi:hypothetical protein
MAVAEFVRIQIRPAGGTLTSSATAPSLKPDARKRLPLTRLRDQRFNGLNERGELKGFFETAPPGTAGGGDANRIARGNDRPDDYLRDILPATEGGRGVRTRFGVENDEGWLVVRTEAAGILRMADAIDAMPARLHHSLEHVCCIRDLVDDKDVLSIRHVDFLQPREKPLLV